MCKKVFLSLRVGKLSYVWLGCCIYKPRGIKCDGGCGQKGEATLSVTNSFGVV
jgi:hypothetical protein